MKKLCMTIFIGLLTLSLFAQTAVVEDKVIENTTNKKGVTFTIYEESDGDIYITVVDKKKKNQIKVSAESKEDAVLLISRIDEELSNYVFNPLKNLIKDYEKKGEWETDDDTGLKYFELDDDDFEEEEIDDDTDDDLDDDLDYDTDDDIDDDTDDDSDNYDDDDDSDDDDSDDVDSDDDDEEDDD